MLPMHTDHVKRAENCTRTRNCACTGPVELDEHGDLQAADDSTAVAAASAAAAAAAATAPDSPSPPLLVDADASADLDALAQLYASLNEEQVLLGLWRRRVVR